MTLKQDIAKIIEDSFEDFHESEKILLNQMCFKKILNNPYYKNQYKNTSIIELEDDAILVLHKYKDQQDTFYESIIDEEYSFYDRDYFFDNQESSQKIKYIYLDGDDYHRLNQFNRIVDQNDDVLNVQSFIKDEIKKDPNYIEHIKNVSYLLGDSSFDSFISHFETRKFFQKDELTNNEYQNYKQRFNKPFLFDKIKNENKYYDKYANEILFIENNVKIKKPYLFTESTLDDVEYVFFEILPVANYSRSYIKDQDDAKIKEYQDIGIKIYNDDLKEKLKEWYEVNGYSEGGLLFHHLFSQHNDISQHLRHNFLGFDYISKNTFSPNDVCRSFLLAMKNGDVIGSLVYQDYMPQNYTSKNKDSLNSHLKSSVTANVKNNYRGMGLSNLLYEKLSKIMMKEKFVYINTYYTDLGNERISKNKERLNQDNKTCFFLDTDLKNSTFLKEYSTRFASQLSMNDESDFISKNIDKIKSIYYRDKKKFLLLKELKDEGKIDFMGIFDEIEKINDQTKNSLDKLKTNPSKKLKR